MPELEDNSIPYHFRNVARSVPETAATMIASLALGNPVGAAVGGLGRMALGRVAPSILSSSAARNALFDLQKLYQSNNASGKITRAVLPTDARTIASMEIGAGLEANSERQQAINELIAEAKQNGTYVPGQTELDAEDRTQGIFNKNFAWISAMNAPQYQMLFGRGRLASGLLPTLGRIGAGATAEGVEESGQELIRAHELDKPLEWKNVRDAFVAGAALGGVMHTAGEIANHSANRENERAEELRRTLGKENSDFVSSTYGNFRQKVSSAIDENLTAKQAEIWDAAQYASARAKEKFGYDIAPELIYKQ